MRKRPDANSTLTLLWASKATKLIVVCLLCLGLVGLLVVLIQTLVG